MSEKVLSALFTVRDLLSRKETAFWTEYKRAGMLLLMLVLSEAASFAPPTSLIRSEACLQQQSAVCQPIRDQDHLILTNKRTGINLKLRTLTQWSNTAASSGVTSVWAGIVLEV